MDTFWTAAGLVLFSRGGEKYAKNWTLSRMAWAEGPWVLRSFNSPRALLFLRQKKKMAVVVSGTKFREVSKIFFCIWKIIDKFAIINFFLTIHSCPHLRHLFGV